MKLNQGYLQILEIDSQNLIKIHFPEGVHSPVSSMLKLKVVVSYNA